MPLQTLRTANARDASAHLAMILVLERCRAGEEFPCPPRSAAALRKGDWLAASAHGLSEWLSEGGFAGEEARYQRAVNVKTAALGRRFLVPTGDISEEL